MINIVKLTTISVVGMAIYANAADVAITDVTAQQRYPWNGKVDISYSAKNIEAKAKEEGLMVSLKVAAIDQDAGTTNVATTLSGDVSLADGTHKIVWDMNAQGLDIKSTNVVFTVSCESEIGLYCIIDLSAGASATSYPVSYTNEIPGGSWSKEYKTKKLVLRRIDPGTCVVTVDQPYYVGIFEMTGDQYALVMNSQTSSGEARPASNMTYYDIRGATPPEEVVDDSFIGKMRLKTGYRFDLPTAAQWEYACRAGTTTTYNYGDTANGEYMWYWSNSGNVVHEVGTRLPNKWGLYDCHGNVEEWCLDTLTYYSWVVKCKIRKGYYHSYADDCTSSSWYTDYPEWKAVTIGFRVVFNMNK